MKRQRHEDDKYGAKRQRREDGKCGPPMPDTVSPEELHRYLQPRAPTTTSERRRREQRAARRRNQGVVRIEVHARRYGPWRARLDLTSRSGTGMVVAWDHNIVTSQHVVDGSEKIFVFVQGRSLPFVGVAPLHMQCRGADLAIIQIQAEKEEFARLTRPLRFGQLPAPNEEVKVIGFPLQSTAVTTTKGEISQYDAMPSPGGGSGTVYLMRVNASINEGNSGGPAVNVCNQVVGLVYAGLQGRSGFDWLVPSPTIMRHIQDILEHNRCTGMPVAGFRYSELYSAAYREHLGVPTMDQGVLVTYIPPYSAVRTAVPQGPEQLAEGDVIMRVAGYDVDSRGTVQLQPADPSRVPMDILYNTHFTGSTMPMQVYRRGQQVDLHVPVSADDQRLIRTSELLGRPSYIMVAGIVFGPASHALIERMGGGVTPALASFVDSYRTTSADEELVMVVDIVATSTTAEQNLILQRIRSKLMGQPVVTINGAPVRHLSDIHTQVYAPHVLGQPVMFGFLDNEKLYLPANAVHHSARSLVEDHKIAPSDYWYPSSVGEAE